MRKHLPYTVALALVLFTACTDSTGPAVRSTMTAQTNGVEFTANERLGDPIAHVSSDGGNVEVRGFSRAPGGATREITVRIHRYTGPGTYRLAVPDSGGSAYYEYQLNLESTPLRYSTRENVSGTVTVDSVNTQTRMIAGHFAFQARTPQGSEASVHSGTFRGRYVVN